MKKLNNKGYMLVEIILASVIAFGVAYFILDLVIKLKNKNDDLFVDTLARTDQAIITNTIMRDIYNKNTQFSCENILNNISVEDNKFKYNDTINDTIIIEVNKYTSSLDLLPTLLNMFGVSYDSRLLIGKDIMSDSSDLVIFNNKSWITNKGRYDYPKKKFEAFTDDVSDTYVDEINEIVKTKFQMSKLIISENYYKSVLGG